jgi:hypothetical protein
MIFTASARIILDTIPYVIVNNRFVNKTGEYVDGFDKTARNERHKDLLIGFSLLRMDRRTDSVACLSKLMGLYIINFLSEGNKRKHIL